MLALLCLFCASDSLYLHTVNCGPAFVLSLLSSILLCCHLPGEAAEVTGANPWLVYGEPLQKLREFGASIKEMDLLDESALSSEQMRVICAIL